MKRPLLALLALAALVSCGQEAATITVLTSPGAEIRYTDVGSGRLPYYTLGTDAVADSSGAVTITVTGGMTGVTRINHGRTGTLLYSLPEAKDTIVFNDGGSEIRGESRPYSLCLQKVEELAQTVFSMRLVGYDGVFSDTLSLDAFRHVADSVSGQVKRFVDSQPVDADFKAEQGKYVDYLVKEAYLYQFVQNVDQPSQEWTAQIREIVESGAWNDPAFIGYRDKSSLLRNLVYAQYKLEGTEPDKIDDPYGFFFDRYCGMFKGEVLSNVLADLLYGDCLQRTNATSVPALFEKYGTMFPDSPYIAVLEPGIKENIRFNSPSEPDPSIYHILPEDPSVESLDELVARFRGKTVYVDVWATWCGPCKDMFKYDEYKSMVEERGLDVEYLYLSIDRPDDRDKWIKSIKYYDLRGYHFMASGSLYESIVKEFGPNGAYIIIPHYMIVAPDGSVAYRDAAAPSEPEKLLGQLLAASGGSAD